MRPAACNSRKSQAELEVDQFMTGLARQESGNPNAVNASTGARGIYQMLPSNWPEWARQAGLPSNAAMTADNQRRVARNQLANYFVAWGSWDNVARGWYAGPGNHNRHSDRLEAGGYPSINNYAAGVLKKVGPLPCNP